MARRLKCPHPSLPRKRGRVREGAAGERLVIASHNSGKIAEIAALLAPYGVRTVGAGALGLPEPEETGASFEENAALKARAAAEASGLLALADDSGLVVPALGGAPGIHSARWAGPDKDFRSAMARVQRELGEKDRRAHFVAVLALAWPDGELATFRGEAHGQLIWPPRGERGFGYDPMFVPDGYDLTFGEMGPDPKHRISHRARAFAKLVEECLPDRWFYRSIVERTVFEFLNKRDDIRLGCLASIALASMSDHAFHSQQPPVDGCDDADALRRKLASDDWAFGCILGVANATKHVVRIEPKRASGERRAGFKDIRTQEITVGNLQCDWPINGEEVMVDTGERGFWLLSQLIEHVDEMWRKKLGL